MFEDIVSGILGAGYPLAFFISFFGSLIAFIPIPYFPVLSLLATKLDPLTLTILSSVGASAAKLIIFLISFWGGSKVGKERRRKMSALGILAERYGWLAVFIAAATPIPDDLVYIPLGVVRFNPLVFLFCTFVGKLIINGLIIYGSALTLPWVFLLMGEIKDPAIFWTSAVALIVVITVAVYYVVTLDWEELLVHRLKWLTQDEVDKKVATG